jgi:hypothetical protein
MEGPTPVSALIHAQNNKKVIRVNLSTSKDRKENVVPTAQGDKAKTTL